MSPIILFLILLAVLLNTVAQLALKTGMAKIGAFAFIWSNFVPLVTKIVASPWIVLGLTVYIMSVIVWLMVLSRTPVSIAYPLSSLAYVTSAFAASYFLHETLSLPRIMGIMVILVGVYLVAKN